MLARLPIFSTLLFLLFFSGKTSIAQNENSQLGYGKINEKYLAHLIKTKVDSVRKSHNCAPLVNDSILFVASKHHSNYMCDRSRLTHDENEFAKTKSPQLRAEYYGAVNYSVGENVLVTSYNTTIKGKKGRVFNTATYGGLADACVIGWVNSPGHFKNIITPDYQITGVTFTRDTVKKELYACQKFATVAHRYSFEENKEMFSYSNYVPDPPITSFDGISNELLDHDHDYDLEHNDLEECTDCKELLREKPYITLQVIGNNFILRIENSEYVKKMVQDKWDGFTVEVVEFNDYQCDNPEYYIKPSRRNGQCKLNGRVIEPKYKKDLLRGFKKRKIKKEVKFVSYLLGADSIPFFKRFSQYKYDRFESEYFEMRLGRVPKNISGLWAYNLVYIQDEQICHIDYFTNYCGELYMDSVTTEFIYPDAPMNYEFVVETKPLNFEIPFEQGKSEFSDSDVLPFISSISDLSYDIDSIRIQAFSSVEGDSLSNVKLQTKRAENIANVLKQQQQDDIPTFIEATTNWEHFYGTVSKSSRWKFLSEMSKGEVIAWLRENGSDELEPILRSERKALIEMHCTIIVNDANLQYYIGKEYYRICDSLSDPRRPEIEKLVFLNKLNDLYGFTFRKVGEGKVDTTFLAKLKMPPMFMTCIPLAEKFVLYGYVYPEAFSKNRDWMTNRDAYRTVLIENNANQCSDLFLYNHSKLSADYYWQQKSGRQDDIEEVFAFLQRLGNFYASSSKAEVNIDRIAFNMNMLLLNYTFTGNPMEASNDARASVTQVTSYYEKYDTVTSHLALKMANISVNYFNVSDALFILSPFMDEDTVRSYAVPLAYQHPSDPSTAGFYSQLLELKKLMSNYSWCNMFMNECQIPFQAFDHEELRNAFCESCMEENEYLKRLYSGELY